MSYLVCDQCGGYYELQPGESPDDFKDTCECGGNLKYVHKLDTQKICPNCGKVTDQNSEVCPVCGFNIGKSLVTTKENNSRSFSFISIVKFMMIWMIALSPYIYWQWNIYSINRFPTNSIGYLFYFYPVISLIVIIVIYRIQRQNTIFKQ
ncbi:MAG: hypothetical protein WCF28_06130 [Methanobacterium sp.]|uniref:hypothetical protein n=1 Tax=Methanobacterium sp. TaxID=2164 RepID=UPI003C780CAA